MHPIFWLASCDMFDILFSIAHVEKEANPSGNKERTSAEISLEALEMPIQESG